MTETEQTESPESTSEGTVTESVETPTETSQESVSVVEQAETQVDKATSDEQSESSAVEPEGAPESYEPFSTPEGVDSLDDDVLTTFADTAKELELPQDKAQALIDAVTPKMHARQQEAFNAQVQSWANEVASDPEIGGEKLDQSVSLARKAYQMGASPALQDLLKQSGMDVHPEMVRMFRYFGSRLSEDKVVDGGEAPSSSELTGDVFNSPGKHMDRLYKKHLS